MQPIPANRALDAYFLEARSKLLDLAGILDRIGRGANPESVAADPRLTRIRQAFQILTECSAGRAEQIQQIFSLEYDPQWPRPEPRL